jgi:ribosomal protein L1
MLTFGKSDFTETQLIENLKLYINQLNKIVHQVLKENILKVYLSVQRWVHLLN